MEDQSPTGVTWKDFLELLKKLHDERPRQEIQYSYSPWFMLSLNDREFKAMCKSNIHVMGGLEGITLMRERMKKLGIKE